MADFDADLRRRAGESAADHVVWVTAVSGDVGAVFVNDTALASGSALAIPAADFDRAWLASGRLALIVAQPLPPLDPDRDGHMFADADGDGRATIASGGDDCNDADPLVFGGAAEKVASTVDLDCDGHYLGHLHPGPLDEGLDKAGSLGSISVRMTGEEASIQLNGDRVGRTPLVLSDLVPGDYALRLGSAESTCTMRIAPRPGVQLDMLFEFTPVGCDMQETIRRHGPALSVSHLAASGFDSTLWGSRTEDTGPFSVSFTAGEAGVSLEVKCVEGGGAGTRVEVPAAVKGNCRVVGKSESATIMTLVTVTESRAYECFAGGTRVCN